MNLKKGYVNETKPERKSKGKESKKVEMGWQIGREADM